MPCYKLGVKFGNMEIVRQFMESRLTGIYFRVLREGDVGVGDAIENIHRDENDIRVKDVVRIAAGERVDTRMLERAIRVKALAEGWRQEFRELLSGRVD
jgi:MOSC domain-containing protein YiiM